LTSAIAKCSVAVLKRTAKNQSIRERMRTVELVLRVFRVGEIARIAIRREEHTDAVAVGDGSANGARERGREHKRGRKIPQQSLWRCHDWVSRDISVWHRSPPLATKAIASSIKAGQSKSVTDAEFIVGCGFVSTPGHSRVRDLLLPNLHRRSIKRPYTLGGNETRSPPAKITIDYGAAI
jgi:hypothetical protein